MIKNVAMIFFGLLLFSCKPQEAEKAKESNKVKEQFTSFELIDKGSKAVDFFQYDLSASWMGSDSSRTNVDIVRLEGYIDDRNQEYSDLRFVFTDNQFEALLYQDTLYLKFFQRSRFSEMGVRVKVVNDKFATTPYRSHEISHNYVPLDSIVQPCGVVEDFLDFQFEINKQILLLNKSSFQVGDKITGNLFYEGRNNIHTSAGPMRTSIYAKGNFTGLVKAGMPFSRTPR